MSISTQHGDAGETSLPGGTRISKSDLRVEAYGTIDELISTMGLARAMCSDPAIQALTASIQRELFSDLNRLSDLLWLFGRLIEVERSVNSSLRDPQDSGPRWSRAW